MSLATEALPKRAPQAGDRFPWVKLQIEPGRAVQDLFQALDDTRFNLLVFGQAAPALPELEGLVRVHEIPISAANEAELARAHVPHTAFYLVRPDGHVGLCGRVVEADAVRRYWRRRIAVGDRSTGAVASVVTGGSC